MEKPEVYQKRRKTYSKISKTLLAGKRYHESLTVRVVDGNYAKVNVYVLTSAEIQDVMEEVAVLDVGETDVKKRIEENAQKMVGNLKLMQKIAAGALRHETADPQAKIIRGQHEFNEFKRRLCVPTQHHHISFK